MMKIFKTVLIPLVSLMSFNITNVKAEINNINVAEVSNNLTKISWHKMLQALHTMMKRPFFIQQI